MGWNHRVMKHKDGEDDFFTIHEVYYNKEGKVDGYTKKGTSAGGNSLQELREDLERMLKSLDKEVLIYESEIEWGFDKAAIANELELERLVKLRLYR
jgi:hypothetical protein